MSNPGGVDFNTSPYFDDYDEDKKFVRVLYRPGRAVQARELTQAQTIQQAQIKRFADYFFKKGALIEGCEQNLDVNLLYCKLQNNYNGTEVDVEDFDGEIIFGANNGIRAYCLTVLDFEGNDPKTIYVHYLATGATVLTVNNAPSTLTPGNTITFSTGNTAVIRASYIDPVTSTNKIFVEGANGILTVTTATTVGSTGTTIPIDVFSVSDKSANLEFDSSETIFTANVTARSYAISAASRPTTTVVDEGLATEQTYKYGSKFTIKEGYVYIGDHFVKNSPQTIILDRYTNVPSYKIGLVPLKTFTDYIGDPSLVDNAQGTPNYLAPGADRFKIDPILTKYGLDEVIEDDDFYTILEVENGIARRRVENTVESKFEEYVAKRTAEESGDYTLNDPLVTVKEHLNTGTNNGRYTAEAGGNTNLLVVQVDPFISYVGGYRNEIIVQTPVEVRKGLDEKYYEQTKTNVNYGNYFEVTEMCGAWDISDSTQVDLYDTVQQAVTSGLASLTTVSGTKIGTARIRTINYVSGTKGSAAARYRVFLHDIQMLADAGTGVKYTIDQVRSMYDAGSPARFADVVVSSTGASPEEASYNYMIFEINYGAIKTLRDTSGGIENGFTWQRKVSSLSFTDGIGTIASDVDDETFVGTGILTDTQKEANYQISIGSSNVTTGALGGIVSVSAASNAVVGTANSSFLTKVNSGDLVVIDGEEHYVNSVTNDTNLILVTNHSGGATNVDIAKKFIAGTIIDMGQYGGDGSKRSINALSTRTVEIDIKEAATFTADVIVTANRANAREKLKVLNYQTNVNINANTAPYQDAATLTPGRGPFGLGYGDIYNLHAVYMSSDFSTPATTSDTEVSQYFTIDSGQRDNEYKHGTITPASGFNITGRLLVVFDHFSHDTSQGLGFCSVDSYPINDSITSNTTIRTENIPVYVSTVTGKIFDLRNCVDFRPIRSANTTSINPTESSTYQVPTYGLRTPITGTDFDADLIHYQGRISKIYINNKGTFGVNDGTSRSTLLEPPPKKKDTLEFVELVIPPYPSLPKDVRIKLMRNRRYTMKDIGKMNERLQRVEYFTSLNFLENQATSKNELDDDGFDRFKNGIIVDSFTGHSIGDVYNGDFSAAVDSKRKYVTAKQQNEYHTSLNYSSASSGTVKATGNKIFLPYTQVAARDLVQLKASKQLSLAEELTFTWTGTLTAYPFADSWPETTNNPDLATTYDDTGDAANWEALIEAWNTEVAPLNTHWYGEETEQRGNIVAGTRQTTNTGLGGGRTRRVTTDVVQFTREAYQQLASGSESPDDAAKSISFDRVVNSTTALFMRQREYVIHVTSLKPGSRVYAFFDNRNITENCYKIRLLEGGNVTQVEELNDLFDNDGYLLEENTSWRAIADGSTDELIVDDNGEIILLFEVPFETFNTGQREFRVTDSPTNSEGTTTTSARNTVFSMGIRSETATFTINSRPYSVSFTGADNRVSLGRQVYEERRIETSNVVIPPPPRRSTDPLSQSFFVDPENYPYGFYATGIDLYFRTKSKQHPQDPNEIFGTVNPGVDVYIRDMENGYPRRIEGNLGDKAHVDCANINVSADASIATRFTFKNPVYCAPNEEYCFTARPDNGDIDYRAWVAELGETDLTPGDNFGKRIEGAYNAGLLFSSSNDRSWTTRQNQDFKFQLYIAEFATTPADAYLINKAVSNTFTYDTVQIGVTDQQIPGTSILYQIKGADASYQVDEDWQTVKNYERDILKTTKQVSNSSLESTRAFKSLNLKATLSTINKHISPYLDMEHTEVAYAENIINNLISTPVDGTVEFLAGNTYVIGTGTDFSNDVFAGEYGLFDGQYRYIENVVNNTFLTVRNAFATSNTPSATMSIRNEENPTGPYSSESRYITRVVELNDGFDATDLVVYLDVNRPPGTSIKVYGKFLNSTDSDALNDRVVGKFWTELLLNGNQTFTLDDTIFTEEKFVISSALKTGGLETLNGTINVTTTTAVTGNGTRFLEDLKIGNTIAVGNTKIEKVITSIANNVSLTVDSAFGSTLTGQEFYRVLNNEISYTTPDGRTYNGYKYFAIKIVFLSTNAAYAPKVKNLRGIALA